MDLILFKKQNQKLSLINLKNMNDSVSFLCQRSLYMRIYEEWKRKKSIENTCKKRRGMLKKAKLTPKEELFVEELKQANKF